MLVVETSAHITKDEGLAMIAELAEKETGFVVERVELVHEKQNDWDEPTFAGFKIIFKTPAGGK
jgi:hypothetical protein